jgi:hypothetical protein
MSAYMHPPHRPCRPAMRTVATVAHSVCHNKRQQEGLGWLWFSSLLFVALHKRPAPARLLPPCIQGSCCTLHPPPSGRTASGCPRTGPARRAHLRGRASALPRRGTHQLQVTGSRGVSCEQMCALLQKKNAQIYLASFHVARRRSPSDRHCQQLALQLTTRRQTNTVLT